MSLIGKVAVVTGPSRSIGAAIVKKLAEQGTNVVVNYVNNANPADDLVNEINANGKGDAVAIKADASTLEGGRYLIDETIKAFGKLDILICNAGYSAAKSLAEEEEKLFDARFATEYLPSPGGRVIFISSSLTSNSAVLPYALSYVAAKGVIEQVARVLAKDLGARGMTVNMVSPGPVNTPLFRDGKSEELIRHYEKLAPSKRLGQPDEIAPAFYVATKPSGLTGRIFV